MGETLETTVQSGSVSRKRAGKTFLTPWRLVSTGILVAAAANAYFVSEFLYDPGYFFFLVHRTYNFNTIALPIMFLMLGALGLVRRRGAAGRRGGKAACFFLCAVGIGLGGLRVYATHIEPYRLQVKTVRLASPKLKTPLRILHVSDIQSPAVGEYEERVFARIRTLEPDLVLHTGDLLQPVPPATVGPETKKMERLWGTVRPALGKFNVVGDTEYWITATAAENIGGLRMLEDKEIVLDHDGSRIRILGLRLDESRDPLLARKVVEAWLREVSSDDYTIVMGHSPDYILGIHHLSIDLCLAGHTHGGQIRLPFIGPPITSSKLPRNLARGFHTIGETRINVSAGVGSEHAAGIPAIRFNCPPEMTVVEVAAGE